MKKSIIALCVLISFGANSAEEFKSEHHNSLGADTTHAEIMINDLNELNAKADAAIKHGENLLSNVHGKGQTSDGLNQGRFESLAKGSETKENWQEINELKNEMTAKGVLAGKGQTSAGLNEGREEAKLASLKAEMIAKGALVGKGQTSATESDKLNSKIDSTRTIVKNNAYITESNAEMISQNRSRTLDNSVEISRNRKQIEKNRQDIINLRKDFEKMGEEMSAGIAGVAAMSNIPHAQNAGQFSVGAGIGNFNSESAVAVGVSYRYNKNITTQVSFATNTGNDLQPVVGAGVAYSF